MTVSTEQLDELECAALALVVCQAGSAAEVYGRGKLVAALRGNP